MKITDPEVIKGGESELIDAITGDMDWGAIGKVFLEKHKLNIDDDVEYKNGDIIVQDNKIAYKLDFSVKFNLSIVLDRQGNYLSLSTGLEPDSRDPSHSSDEPVKDEFESEGHEYADDACKLRMDEATENSTTLSASYSDGNSACNESIYGSIEDESEVNMDFRSAQLLNSEN